MADKTITIRPAQAGDLSAIMAIENHCFTTDAWSEENLDIYLQESLHNSAVPLVMAFGRAAADDNEIPAGYCLGNMIKKNHGVIISLAVDTNFRGLRLGRELLERVCNSLRNVGARKITLEVKPENLPAIQLYETSGFQKTRILPHYYPDGNDAQRMTRHYTP
jgi:[ribosomal protein S18]-alanine N-acetyltransferase